MMDGTLTHAADRDPVAGFLADLVSRGDYPAPLYYYNHSW